MKFSPDTLRTSSRNFEKALVDRGLKLPYQQSQNLWAQIIVGKNYSAASAQAKSRGYIEAGKVSQESICEFLASAKRPIALSTATEIYSEAIADDLATASHSLSELLAWLQKHPSYRVASLVSEQVSRLGLMDSEHGGYIPVGTTELFQLQTDEIPWIRENSGFLADVLNRLVGHSQKQCHDIFLANMRAAFDQEDKMFAAFIGYAGEAISKAIGEGVLREVGTHNLPFPDAHDYDQIRWAVYDVFEDKAKEIDTTWLKPDRGLAEAVIDHIAGRIKQDLRLIADGVFPEDVVSDPASLFADTALHAMRRFIREEF